MSLIEALDLGILYHFEESGKVRDQAGFKKTTRVYEQAPIILSLAKSRLCFVVHSFEEILQRTALAERQGWVISALIRAVT